MIPIVNESGDATEPRLVMVCLAAYIFGDQDFPNESNLGQQNCEFVSCAQQERSSLLSFWYCIQSDEILCRRAIQSALDSISSMSICSNYSTRNKCAY